MNADYKVKAEYIFHSGKKGTENTVTVLYNCDPVLNIECDKTLCGDCRQTSDIRFAKKYKVDDEA